LAIIAASCACESHSYMGSSSGILVSASEILPIMAVNRLL